MVFELYCTFGKHSIEISSFQDGAKFSEKSKTTIAPHSTFKQIITVAVRFHGH